MKGVKRIFSDDEKKYIIDNYDKESIHSMAKRFNCSWNAIKSVLKENHSELRSLNKWSEDEVNTLIKLSAYLKLDDICKAMNKSKIAVYSKAKKLNITLRMNKRKWSKEEEQYFKEHWGTIPIEVLANKLKRSVFSLRVKAVRMKLGPMILNNTDVLSLSDICDILGVSRSIINNWKKYGLDIKYKKITSNKGFYYVEWDDLLYFLKNHQNLWDANNVELYILGDEEEWLKEKRKKDALNKPLSYRFWSDNEKKQVINYFNLGYSYEDIARLVHRSQRRIAIFLNSNGYYISSRNHWTDEEIQFLKDNYLKMTYDELAMELHKKRTSVEYHLSKYGCLKRTLKKKY